MSKSNCEEIIGILWFILCLILFDKGYMVLGKIAFGLGVFAMSCSIVLALRKARMKKG